MERYLETKDISVRFGNHIVLDSISVDFHAGHMTAVIGSNGVGKTTYLKAIAHLIPSSGTIALREDGEAHYNEKEIAYVPQLGALQTKLTVFEMVLLGLVHHLRWHVTEEQIDRVYEILRELNLTALAEQPFQTLSGGQKQLVSMAQSLIAKPKVLLLDEPTSALDLRHQLIVMDIAREYTVRQNAVTIFVVHDMMLASRYGKELLVLHENRVRACGRAEEVLTPELIAEVYNVSADVIPTEQGHRMVLPIKPL